MKYKTLKLGEIAFQDRNIVPPESDEAAIRPYLGLDQIESQTGKISTYDSNSAEGNSTTFAFDTKHVLYGKLRPYLNKVAIPERKGRCSTEIIPLIPCGVDREFLAFLLRRSDVVALVMSKKTGSRMPRTDMDVLLEFEVTIPELIEDQRQIVTFLNTQLAEVEKARHAAEKQIDEYVYLENSFFHEAYRRVVPVSVPHSFDEPPSGWSWRKLNKVARLESGHTPSRLRADWWGGDVSWISLTEIRELDGKWTKETKLKTNEEGIANSAARVLPTGTVCYSRTASVGFVTVMASPMATSQDFANWVCSDELDPEFLMYALICARKELKELATGATHKTIYMPTLKTFHICAPGIQEQKKIVKKLKIKLDELESINSAIKTQANELSSLPNRILAKAFEI